MGLATPMLYLCSGVILNTLSQVCRAWAGYRESRFLLPFCSACSCNVLPCSPVAFSGSRLSNQIITDTKFSAPEAHIIPAVKFTFTLVGAALRRPPRVVASPSQRRLMALIGLLDASAYTVYCLGSSCCSLRCCCRPA